MTCKIVTIVGARPQFIKAAAVSREILKRPGKVEEVMGHTGQHYDPNMSQVFFDELEIPTPKYNLEVSGGGHGSMTGRMPEEVNRILSDRISSLLLCPADLAVGNLAIEGINQGVHNVGDVMYDVALYYRDRAKIQSNVLQKNGLQENAFALATCHRAENTDAPARLEGIVSALAQIALEMPVILPLHPRTRKLLQRFGLEHHLGALIVIDPLPFLDMVALELAAKVILTDSGGVQKEAFFYQVPCITMRDETEWVETVELGWNRLVGASREAILDAYAAISTNTFRAGGEPYGDGRAAERILSLVVDKTLA